MCGIAGAIDPDGRRAAARVRTLNDLQAHRGPDHAALVAVGSFTLGNTRLAIQDPSPVGNQPFWSRDGRYLCVFNGEIYNYKELIAEYGLELPSQCDGAVIPELWARLGPKCLLRFRGMYAVAVVDTTEDTLTICRDPFGIKPVYYRRLADGTTAFASEVRPLDALEPAPILADAVVSYLRLGAVAADQSPFQGIEAVPPNTALRFSREGSVATAVPIFQGTHPLTESLVDEPASDLGPTFVSSVDVHLRADVPTALLLSSGVDSAAIAAAAHQLGRTLHCLTVSGSGSADEVEGAARTAARYGHHHEVVASRLEDDDVNTFFRAMQRPSVDGLNSFIVCRAVQRRGFRVALSGLGGDEAFGGYPHYRLLPWLGPLRVFDKAPERLWRLATGAPRSRRREKLWRLLQPGGPRTAYQLDLLQRELFPPDAVETLSGTRVRTMPAGADEGRNGATSFQILVEAEIANYMQPMLLLDADAFSMCSSIELRVPYVDRPLFTAVVGPRRRDRRAPGKQVLADALQDEYLRHLVRQPKRGFTVPTTEWMRTGPFRSAAEKLRDNSAPLWDHVDSAIGRRVLDDGSTDRWQQRWALVALNGWLASLADDRRSVVGS
jgi:asparagine synthase (glutamine-hydrolysing)